MTGGRIDADRGVTYKRHIRLFLGSSSDVALERDAVEAVVERFNRLFDDGDIHVSVVRWEDRAAPGWMRPQEQVRRDTEFERTDIFVGIFWSRIGIPTGRRDPETGEPYLGGTVEEFRDAKRLFDQGRVGRIMLYFCTRDVRFPPNLSREALRERYEQLARVAEFRETIRETEPGLFYDFGEVVELERKFLEQLKTAVDGLVRRPTPPAGGAAGGASTPVGPVAGPAQAEPVVVEPPPPNPQCSGPAAWKLCDRVNQTLLVRDSLPVDGGGVHAFVLFGDEDEAHDSLVDRFVDVEVAGTRLHRREASSAAAVVARRVDWPEPVDDERKARRFLQLQLFTSFDPAFRGRELADAAFLELDVVRASEVIVIRHEVRLHEWDSERVGLIRWYLTRFWKDAAERRAGPTVLIFLSLVCLPPMSRVTPAAAAAGVTATAKERMRNDLVTMARARTRFRPIVLPELASVDEGQVETWLRRYTQYDDAYQFRRQLLRYVLGPPAPDSHGEFGARCMREVQYGLKDILSGRPLVLPSAL